MCYSVAGDGTVEHMARRATKSTVLKQCMYVDAEIMSADSIS